MFAQSARRKLAFGRPEQSSTGKVAGPFALGRRTVPLIARPASHARRIHGVLRRRILRRPVSRPRRFSKFLIFSILLAGLYSDVSGLPFPNFQTFQPSNAPFASRTPLRDAFFAFRTGLRDVPTF